MKKIFLLCFIVAIILPNISTQALPTYWDMWQYFSNYTLLTSKTIQQGNYKINLTTIKNYQQYDQLRLLVYCIVNTGGNQPWQIMVSNPSNDTPNFVHRIYGYAMSNNQYSYQSQNIILPISTTGIMNIDIKGNGGTSQVYIYLTAAKHTLNNYLIKYPQLSQKYNIQKQNIKQIESEWQKWIYFTPINLIDSNITNSAYNIDFSKIANITKFQCIKNYVYLATGRTYGSGDFNIIWKNNDKPYFQHRTYGDAYNYQTGFSFNSQNIIMPLSTNLSVLYRGTYTPGGGYDFIRSYYFGMKYKSTVTKNQRDIITKQILKYIQNPKQYQNQQQIQSSLKEKSQKTNLKQQNIQQNDKTQPYSFLDPYPYPGYWGDWFYISPPIISVTGYTKPGKYLIDFSNVTGVKLCDEVKIWVYTYNGVSGGGSWTFNFKNQGTPSFQYYTKGFSGGKGGVTYNSQQFVAPISKNSKLYFTVSGTFSGNTFTYVQVVALKFKDDTMKAQRQEVLLKLQEQIQ